MDRRDVLIFHVLRPDVLPLGDIGIQKAIAKNFNGGIRPGPDEMVAIAEPWRPWRSIGPRPILERFQFRTNLLDDNLSNGLLQINLVRRLPEAMKPRRIKIKGEPSKLIENSKAA